MRALLAAAACSSSLPAAAAFKVIGVGYPRTGIRSLDVGLEKLGYMPYRMGHTDAHDKGGHQRDLASWLSIINSTDTVELENLTSKLLNHGYDAILDVPLHVTDVSLRLIQFFPEAKIILTVHPNSVDWFNSFRIHMREFDHSSARWSPSRHVVMNSRAHALRKVHTADVKKMGLPFVPRESDGDAYIAAYEAHNADIRNAVDAGRFLEFEARSGWEPLCHFLDKPVPLDPYPHLFTFAREMRHVKAQEDYIFKFEIFIIGIPLLFVVSVCKHYRDKWKAASKVMMEKASV